MHEALKRFALVALLLAGCDHKPTVLVEYRVQRVSPAGTIHGEWIVESASYPIVEADYSGNSFVKIRTDGDWTYTGLFAPTSWLLNVVEEK